MGCFLSKKTLRTAEIVRPVEVSAIVAAEVDGSFDLTDELLGTGATSKVWLASFGDEKVKVAAKVCSKKQMDAEDLKSVREEIALHRTLNHRNIVKLHAAKETEISVSLVLQLCNGGSLVDTMEKSRLSESPLSEGYVRAAFTQLLDAILYLSSLGIHHLDIKLANGCWVDASRTHLVLIDFGHATTRELHSEFIGTAQFAAPEVQLAATEAKLERSDKPGAFARFAAGPADVWSLGVVLYAMLATALPFDGEEDTCEERKVLREKVCAGKWDAPLQRPKAAKDLCQRMLTVSVKKRASLKAVKAHVWVQAAG